MAKVFVGLGSNLGDRKANLRAAIDALAELGRVGALSRVYETAPLYVLDQPAFLNMAAALECALTPEQLLTGLKALEDRLGRVASRRYGPRHIDLDILLYDDLVMDAPTLTIPHPRLCERRFALAPLADIAAQILHPSAGTTIARLLAVLPDTPDDRVTVLADTLTL